VNIIKKTTVFALLSVFVLMGTGAGGLFLNVTPNATKVVEDVSQTATTQPVTVVTNLKGGTLGQMTISIVMENKEDASSVNRLDYKIKNVLINHISELTPEELSNYHKDLEKPSLVKDLETELYLKIKDVLVIEAHVVK
jgi:flagellar basal body-associated protein FliL